MEWARQSWVTIVLVAVVMTGGLLYGIGFVFYRVVPPGYGTAGTFLLWAGAIGWSVVLTLRKPGTPIGSAEAEGEAATGGRALPRSDRPRRIPEPLPPCHVLARTEETIRLGWPLGMRFLTGSLALLGSAMGGYLPGAMVHAYLTGNR